MTRCAKADGNVNGGASFGCVREADHPGRCKIREAPDAWTREHEAWRQEVEAHPVVEGDYNLCRITGDKPDGWPDQVLAVRKGDTILGVIAPHPCGEWCFWPDANGPALRSQALGAIASMISQAEEAWNRTEGALPGFGLGLIFTPRVTGEVEKGGRR